MASIKLQSSFSIDYFSFFTVAEFKERYLAGLPLPSSITDALIQFHLDSSISEVEKLFDIKYIKTYIIEEKDFNRDDWLQWNYVRTTFPLVHGVTLHGFLNTTKQITYPDTWLSIKTTNDNTNYSRRMSLVPTRNSAHSEALVFSGIVPQAHYFHSRKIPDYWNIEYITGWDNPPLELIDLLGKLTACKVLQIISDALMSGAVSQSVDQNGQSVFTSTGSNFGGLGQGISSKSISIDGLSQSYSSYVNGQTGIYGARMKQYMGDLDRKNQYSFFSRMNDLYGAVVMGVF